MPESALEILREINPDSVPADAPPPAANYREADLQGISCAGCAKFVYTGEAADEDGEPLPTGYCSQWEANVRGDMVSDAFADSGPPLDQDGNEIWDFSDTEGQVRFAEILLSGTDASEVEDSQFVQKEVLRTGEWPVIPTRGGKVKKPLRIIRDGKSDFRQGVIAMSELVENFKAGAIPAPQIPLSDDNDDHKNTTRVNTGFVRDLWIVDDGDDAKLVAKMEFTEPEVREKVLRGTYADVSCGIPWGVNSRGKTFGSTVEHVAITNRPFIDGLGPFVAMSDTDKENVEVIAFGDARPEEPEEDQPEVVEEETPPTLSQDQILASAHEAVTSIDGVKSSDYVVAFSEGQSTVFVRNSMTGDGWTVPFTVEDEKVVLSQFTDWKIEEKSEAEKPTPRRAEFSALEQAQKLRAIRLSQNHDRERKESHMALTREQIEGMEGLDDTQRAAMLSMLDENASLRASTREAEVDGRVTVLSDDLGLKERPGFLKLYRQIALSDDGGPAAVLLSDNGGEKVRLTAVEILDRAIEALKGSDGKVHLSDQAIVSGNDNPPPADAEEETKPVEERLAAVREELYGPKK